MQPKSEPVTKLPGRFEPLPFRHLETFGGARRLWNGATSSDTSSPSSSHQIPPAGGRPLHAKLIRRAPLVLVRRLFVVIFFFSGAHIYPTTPAFSLTVFFPQHDSAWRF